MSGMTAASQQLEELCYLTAQSMTSLKTTDHFRVIKQLGEGSYGKVMLAVHRKRGTPMALKFFPRGSTSLFSFLREYNLCLSFGTHPSLTRALGIVFSTPTDYVFAQQPGLYGDLFDVIVPEVGMQEESVQSVVSQLSGAISYLHSLGFVHRDVKPENVFLCDSACRWVKLGDFGLTRARGSQVRAVWYESPYCVPEVELAKSRKRPSGSGKQEEEEEEEDILISVEPTIDSWAFGIVIYCMLTGCFPWNETSSDDPSYKKYKDWFYKEENGGVRHQDSDMPPSHFASLSSLALSLFQKLLNPDPAQRAGPGDALGYLGGAWTLKAEVEEKRRQKEAEEEKRRVRERGCLGEKELGGKGER